MRWVSAISGLEAIAALGGAADKLATSHDADLAFWGELITATGVQFD